MHEMTFDTSYYYIIMQLFGEIISRLELRSKEKDPIMYELYVIFKDMAILTESMQLTERYTMLINFLQCTNNSYGIDCRERSGLRVLSYHLWFSSMAVNWIDTALKKGRERIELAIENDKVHAFIATLASMIAHSI